MPNAIDVSELTKSYGKVEALRGVSFEVAEGEVFGLLGPNGAGKTTTVEILEGYRARDGGEANVLGHDPGDSPRALRERIGVVLQQSELSPLLTVAETHRLFAGYYSSPRDVDEVIELVGLGEKRDARVKTLSGGQKRRLDLGVALVGNPDLVFLDEPTTGFDPAARRAAWDMIRSLRSLGTTILLTTHYLDEAQQLADRVAVLRDGVIVRQGTPSRVDRRVSSHGDPLPARRRARRGRDERSHSSAQRADGRGAGDGTGARAPRGATTNAGGRLSRARGRGARMSTLLHQLRFEQKVFWRSREAAVFIFIFPLLLYALLGSVYGDEIDGVPAVDVLLAGLFGYGAANTAFAGLAIILVGRREAGVLKRLRATPLTPAVYLTAVLLSTLATFALQSVSLLGLGGLAFDASMPANWLGFAGAIVLGVACFAGLGLAAAALIRSAEGVSAVVNVVVLPMAFLSGAFGPTQDFPAVLQAIADVLPLTYFIDIVDGVYLDGDSFFADPKALAIVLAWGLAGVVVALRRFGWMPRER